MSAQLLSKDKLNVLFIASDDLRPDLGCYGNTIVHSPNIDRLASESVVFNKAYCQQAVCAPSRASIMSGCRPDTTKVYDLSTPLRSTLPNVLTLPQFYKQQGYETISVGKIYHHNNEDKNSWTQPSWKGPKGDWRNYLNPKYKHVYYPTPAPAWESQDVDDSAYKDGQVVDRAIQHLDQLKSSDKNFFLAVGLVKPHLPFNAPKKYWDLYKENFYNPARREWPQDTPKIAKMGWHELRAYTDIPKDPYSGKRLSKAQDLKLRQGYYACISYIDALIGKLINKLQETGLDKNTVIVLWGDHGFKLGDYGAWCKHSNFEIDTRVPLIIKAPGIKHLKTDSLAELVDVYPTLASLTGHKVPQHCEGSDLSKVMSGQHKGKKAAFSQYPRGKNMGYTVTDGKWRYTEWYNTSSTLVGRELFDHSQGSIAEANLAHKPEFRKIRDQLTKTLNKGQGWKEVKLAMINN